MRLLSSISSLADTRRRSGFPPFPKPCRYQWLSRHADQEIETNVLRAASELLIAAGIDYIGRGFNFASNFGYSHRESGLRHQIASTLGGRINLTGNDVMSRPRAKFFQNRFHVIATFSSE